MGWLSLCAHSHKAWKKNTWFEGFYHWLKDKLQFGLDACHLLIGYKLFPSESYFPPYKFMRKKLISKINTRYYYKLFYYNKKNKIIYF